MSKLDDVLSLAKSKGYFWPSFEIYGGVSGFYTFGPMGITLMNGIQDLWRHLFKVRFGFIELSAPNIMPYQVLKASGHVDNFKDPMAECRKCGFKYRADHLLKESGIQVSEGAGAEELESILNSSRVRCPKCGGTEWSVKLYLNMFETNIGPYANSKGFLRPETAQGIFVEFNQLYSYSREKLPMGVVQIGPGFRNEISPRQGLIRLREFHMMELELFFDPEDEQAPELPEDDRLMLLHEKVRESGVPEALTPKEAYERGIIRTRWMAYFLYLSKKFLNALGVPDDRQRFYEKVGAERAHYSAQTFDHEVLIDELGWIEVAGFAYRTDYDLKSHMSASGTEMYAVKRRVISTKQSVMINRDELKKRENWQQLINLQPEVRDDGVYLGDVKLREGEYRIIQEVEREEIRKFVPHVVEPSFGLDRLMLVTLYYAYGKREGRNVLSIPKHLLGNLVAVLPLVTKEELTSKALEVREVLLRSGFEVVYDDRGYIGKRYARLDEAGVPFAVTIDSQTLQDDTVTVRDRDTWAQTRVKISELATYLREMARWPL
ncbi:MAG: glycine--tRNA ligase [Nitrososphaeria archaeon]